MAIYELKCATCDHQWEVIQKYDDPLPECDECEEGGPVMRMMSTGGFTIDWYTGY